MSTKPSRSGSPNTKKSEEMSDSAEPSIRQDIGQMPVIHASRTEENAVHWIQLLHALEQPDFLGWPLLTPIKLPLQKCKKCSLEFCSPINYRRHIRVHRQSSTLNKESSRNKDLLAAFWDKLPLEKAKELVAFNEATLKEIPGASIVTALASSLCNPAVWALPHVYVRAGSLLLDIVQATPSRQPISSQELFGILDDASEKTFLCGGTPESVQNYLFDGEATKTCLEFKNLVASTSFLFERQLVKAWVADKDAEALRCQKLLVEEEEAAKKRFAELAKRKKQKKLRRKEHKLKELSNQCEGDLNVAVNAAESPVLAQVSVPSCPSDSRPNSIYGLENRDSGLESLQNQEEGLEEQIDSSSGNIIQGDSETVESQIACISNSTYGPENIDAGLESPQSPEKDLEGQIDICSEGNTQGNTENIESQMAGESSSIHGPENVDAGLESPQHPEKEVEVQNDLSSINQGDNESIDSQIVGESDSIHGPVNANAGLESPQHLEKEVEVQHDLNSGVINQGDKESIDSQMMGESDSVHEPENVNAGLESPQHPEKEEVEVQNDLSSRVINKGDTESIDSQMVGDSDTIHGPENLEVGFESKPEKDLKAAINTSSGGVTKGETETVDSHKVCESNQETHKFYSLTPLNRSRVSTKKDKMGSCGNFVNPSLVDGKCCHEHFVETEIEVLIGSISCKVSIPPFITIGDIVVTEKAGYPIMFRKGPSVPTPYNHCVNQNHALSSNNGLQGITPAAAKEFMRQST